MEDNKTSALEAASATPSAAECDSVTHREVIASASTSQPPITSGGVRVNPQIDRLRQNLLASSVQDSLDDDEMREYDPSEHLETLGAGIPPHLAQKTGPRYIKPRHFDSTDDETASVDYSATGESADELELSPVVKATFGNCSMTLQTTENVSASGDRFAPDMTSLKVGGAACSTGADGV